MSEQVGSRLQISRPAKPASMASVNVHGHVGQIERLKSILDTLIVRGLCIGALGHVEIGHHVGETVGLDHKQNADIAEGGELHLDCVDVGLVVGHAIVGNAILAIGGGGSAVSVWEIVNDKQPCVSGRGASCVGRADVAEGLSHQSGHFSRGVTAG